MKNFAAIKDSYLARGVTEDNIDYAIIAVKEGSKREHILDNLVADYRGMQTIEANQLLEALFAANGGEFKKENRGGYLFGIVFLMIGFFAIGYIVFVNDFNGAKWLLIIWAAAIVCPIAGIGYIVASMRGKYRDEHDPFKD